MSNASVVVPVSELTFPKRRSDEIVFIKSSHDALRAANKHLPRSRLPRVINYENVNRQRILLITEKQEDKMKKKVSQRHESLAKMFLNEVQRKKARWAKEKAFFMMGLTLDTQ